LDTSFDDPRPTLLNQQDLIDLRTQSVVHKLMLSLTGWARIDGRDELPIPQKVTLDVEYLHRRSLPFDIYILLMTAVKDIRRDGIVH